MSNVNLKTCTKKELGNSIKYVFDKTNINTYIYLEDIYNDEPTIFYSPNHRKYNGKRYAEINVLERDMRGKIISHLEDEEGLYDTLDGFIDKLFDYIVKEYR